jgi:hypothetical protein
MGDSNNPIQAGAQHKSKAKTKSAQRYIARFKVSGLLRYEQSYVVTAKQLAAIKEHGDVEIDKLCSCDGCELCGCHGVYLGLIDATPISRISPTMRLLMSELISLETVMEAVND